MSAFVPQSRDYGATAQKLSELEARGFEPVRRILVYAS